MFFRTPFPSSLLFGLLLGLGGCQQGLIEPNEDACTAPEGVVRPDGWTEDTHCKGVDANYAVVFDDSIVRRLDITISAEQYQATKDNLEDILGGGGGGGGGGGLDDSEEPMYVPVTVDYNGHTWWNVGMRYKGNSSLHSAYRMGIEKYAFRFNFDKFEDDHPEINNQRFYGFKKMTFSNGFKDNSLIRDKVAADIFRAAGVPAARGTFIRIYVDYGDGPKFFGIYTMIEDPSDEMLTTQFDDDSGNLYKPEGYGATWQEFVADDFAKKTNEDAADWSDIMAAIDALHQNTSDRDSWRNQLESIFNVDAFLRCLAINQLMVNWDSYGQMDHNYYVYGDPSDGGRLVWFPWDLNESMLTSGPGGSSFATSLLLDTVTDEWPLIRYILDDTLYADRYRSYLTEALDGAFNEATVHTQLENAHAAIAPYVAGSESTETAPYTFIRNLSDFETALEGNRGLIQHISDRHDAAQEVLK